jgi:PAS domain S-box-containing protein
MVVLFLLMTEFLFVGILSVELFSLQSRLKKQHQERAILAHLTKATACIVRLNFGMSREQFLLQGSERGSESNYPMYMAALDKELNAIELLVRDDPVPRKELESIQEAKRIYINDLKNRFKSSEDMPHGRVQYSQSLRAMVSDRTSKMISRYGVDVKSAERTTQNLLKIKQLLLLGLLVNLATVLIAGIVFWKQVTRRIMLVTDNVSRFAQGEPLLGEVDGNDEITQVDALFRRLSSELVTAADQEQSMFQTSMDVICSVDSRGVFTDVSPACLEQWGFEPDELIGCDVAEKLGTKNVPFKFQEGISDVLHDSHFEEEDEVIRKDGTIAETLWAAHWSPNDGSFFCFVRDAGASKQFSRLLVEQENQIRQSIENIPLGILTVSENGTIQTANKTAVELLGTDNGVTKASLDAIMKPINQTGDRLSKMLLESSPSSPIRCNASTFDGNDFFVDVTVGQSPKAEQDSLIVLFEDASERVRLEQLKHDYVNLLGQQLRNPLSDVREIISAQVELTDKSEEKQHQRLERTVINIDRLLRLIDELLDIEKLAAGKLVNDLTPCSVPEAIHVAVNAVRDHAEQQKIRIELQTSNANVMADEQRLVQVIVNLLTNAIKYSPANTSVMVEAGEFGEAVEIRVIDCGRGLPPAMHEKIFESYVQAEKSDSKRGLGTGLGLAICKQIIERHNGTIGVESEEGKGSKFWIRLPRLSKITEPKTESGATGK